MNVAFINHKGGVGKTTLSVNTAFRYAEKKRDLIFVDFDEQRNAIQLFSGYTWDESVPYFTHSKGYVTAYTGVFEGMDMEGADILFDCPPSFDSSYVFIDFLKKQNIDVNVWIIPVESRTSISGADTITYQIRKNYPSARIIFVMNRCQNNSLTFNDRAEIARFPNVEFYKQVIPQATAGLTKFEQGGGRPVWEFYKSSRCAVSMRNFCDWLLGGCSTTNTFKNNNSVDLSGDSDRKIFVETRPSKRRVYGEY